MLQVFFGTDNTKVREAAFAELEKLREEGFSVDTITEENFQTGLLSSLANSQALFGENFAYLVDALSAKQFMYDELVSQLSALAESTNAFLILEGPLLAAEKKHFSKYAKRIEEYKAGAKERFNNFSLADALAKKDRRSLWVLYHEARLENISVEEIIGVLWWQLKTLRLASLTKSAGEAGLKEFPYSKAKRALSKFQSGELELLSRSLLSLAHDSRLGLSETDHALERWILRL